MDPLPISHTALKPALDVAEGLTPPVVAADHEALLRSEDPRLEANKRFCYEMYRTVLQAGHSGRVREFIAANYIQHNPNAASGAAALEEFVRRSRPERPIEADLKLPLVAIVAERDMVTFVFVRKEEGDDGEVYYTSWFDVFRLENGLIAEHWDPALKSPDMLKLDPNKKRIGT